MYSMVMMFIPMMLLVYLGQQLIYRQMETL